MSLLMCLSKSVFPIRVMNGRMLSVDVWYVCLSVSLVLRRVWPWVLGWACVYVTSTLILIHSPWIPNTFVIVITIPIYFYIADHWWLKKIEIELPCCFGFFFGWRKVEDSGNLVLEIGSTCYPIGKLVANDRCPRDSGTPESYTSGSTSKDTKMLYLRCNAISMHLQV